MWLIRLLEHLLLGQKILVSFAVVRISIWTWWYCFDDDEEEGDEEEAFADVVVVVIAVDVFAWKADSGFIIILSCIALTLATSDGPFTNILLTSHARFVGDHIFVMPSGTCPFQSGPARR